MYCPQAKAACLADRGCVAFTYHDSRAAPPLAIRAYLKGVGSSATGDTGDAGWSYFRKGRAGCFVGMLHRASCSNRTKGWTSFARDRPRPRPPVSKPFLAASFGDHMVLQRAPQQAVIFGPSSQYKRYYNRVLVSLWDSLMFGRVLKSTTIF